MRKVMKSLATRIYRSRIGWLFNMELWREPLCFLGLIASIAFTMFIIAIPSLDAGTKQTISAVLGWIICALGAVWVGIVAFAIWQKRQSRATQE